MRHSLYFTNGPESSQNLNMSHGEPLLGWVTIGAAQHLQQEPGGGGLQQTQAGHMSLDSPTPTARHEY